MKTTPKKAAARKSTPPTRKELTEQLEGLRRKVQLLRKYLAGEACGLELKTACGVTGSKTAGERRAEAGALFRCTIELDYVLQGEA